MNLALSKRNDFCKLRIEEPAAPLKLRPKNEKVLKETIRGHLFFPLAGGIIDEDVSAV